MTENENEVPSVLEAIELREPQGPFTHFVMEDGQPRMLSIQPAGETDQGVLNAIAEATQCGRMMVAVFWEEKATIHYRRINVNFPHAEVHNALKLFSDNIDQEFGPPVNKLNPTSEQPKSSVDRIVQDSLDAAEQQNAAGEPLEVPDGAAELPGPNDDEQADAGQSAQAESEPSQPSS